MNEKQEELIQELKLSNERIEKIKSSIQEKISEFKIIRGFFIFALIVISFSQFFLFDRYLGEKLGLIGETILGFEVKSLIGLLVTGSLPITSLIDESGILEDKRYILYTKIPVIYLILSFDLCLTFQAIYLYPPQEKIPFTAIIAFLIAAVFSITSLSLSRAIVKISKKIESKNKDLNILDIYEVDPDPLYKDVEQIKLREEMDAAIEAAQQARETLEEETNKYREDLQHREFEYNQERQKLEGRIAKYKDHLDSVSDLKKRFNKVKKPIIDLVSQGKGIFEKFGNLDESIKEFKFPSLAEISEENGEIIEKSTYYWAWKNSDDLQENSELLSKLSPPGRILLQAVEQQQLPKPLIRSYAPRDKLSRCLVLDFDNYDVVVYCRDEEFSKEKEQWNDQDELDFKGQLSTQQTSKGICTLVFSPQQIMRSPSGVLEQIQDAINSRLERDFN